MWVGHAFDGDMQAVIVPVPIFVGAFTKYLSVLFFRPFVHPEFVGGVKAFNSSDVHHALTICLRLF